MTITKERKQELIGTFRQKEADTGSPEVQVAILTSRINGLTEHLREHKGISPAGAACSCWSVAGDGCWTISKRVDPQRYLDIIRRLEIRK